MLHGKWKFTRKRLNRYWGLLSTSVLRPPQRVEVSEITLFSSDLPPSGPNEYIQPPVFRSIDPHSLTRLTRALCCTRPGSPSGMRKGTEGCWEVHVVQCGWSIKVMPLFLLSFHPCNGMISSTWPDIVQDLLLGDRDWSSWGPVGPHGAMEQSPIFRDVNTG